MPDLPDLPEMGGRTAGPNLPTTRAGGQDDGSYTNSLKLATGIEKLTVS